MHALFDIIGPIVPNDGVTRHLPAEAMAGDTYVLSVNMRPVYFAREECIENGDCYSGAAIDGAKDAVALMRYVERRRTYICSGGLVNSTENPGTPYFLTANHCIDDNTAAATLENRVQQLEEDLRRVERERDVLKKALAIFSQRM